MEIKYLKIEHLETLPTPRLLNYYKKTLKRIRKYQNSFYCSCCGSPNYEIDGKLYTKDENKERKQKHESAINDSENYLKSIKKLLNTRENVN